MPICVSNINYNIYIYIIYIHIIYSSNDTGTLQISCLIPNLKITLYRPIGKDPESWVMSDSKLFMDLPIELRS